MKLHEFDFRVWDKKNKTYFKSLDYLCVGKDPNSHNLVVLNVAEDGSGYDMFCDSPDCEIELWIGHYDKNGKKIYEGDIIRSYEQTEYFNKVHIVNFDSLDGVNFTHFINKDKSISLESFEIFGYSFTWHNIIPLKGIEVIGNIHENSELLIENN